LVLLGEKGKLLLSPQQVVIGDHKDTTGTMSPNTMVDPDYPHRALKNKGIVDSGCSRHMTGNKAYLAEFQDFNGGPVAFGGSKGYITGKGSSSWTLRRNGLVRGLPKLKYHKDYLCSACAMGKSKKQTLKPKDEDSNKEKLYLLHMDLCGPMRVQSVNRKWYIL
ncbi:hypothetical protein Tco_1096397, partial [Tanacetum coccineum]